MPGIPTNLWGASPLYENETFTEKALYQRKLWKGASTS